MDFQACKHLAPSTAFFNFLFLQNKLPTQPHNLVPAPRPCTSPKALYQPLPNTPPRGPRSQAGPAEAAAPAASPPAASPPAAAAPRRSHSHLGELGGGPAGHLGHAELRQLHLQIVQLLQQLLLLLPAQVSGLDLGLRAPHRPSAPLPGTREPASRRLPPPPAAPQAPRRRPPPLPPARRRMPPDCGRGSGPAHHDGSTGAARGGRDGSRAGPGGGGCCRPEPTNPRPAGGRSLRFPRGQRGGAGPALAGTAGGSGAPAPGEGAAAPLCRGGSVLPPAPAPPSAARALSERSRCSRAGRGAALLLR